MLQTLLQFRTTRAELAIGVFLQFRLFNKGRQPDDLCEDAATLLIERSMSVGIVKLLLRLVQSLVSPPMKSRGSRNLVHNGEK
jgi:hypothetical protein